MPCDDEVVEVWRAVRLERSTRTEGPIRTNVLRLPEAAPDHSTIDTAGSKFPPEIGRTALGDVEQARELVVVERSNLDGAWIRSSRPSRPRVTSTCPPRCGTRADAG